MDRIETQLAIRAPLAEVFDTITHPENIPMYAPGIDEAHERRPEQPEAPGNLLDLITRSGRHMDGRIVDREAQKAWAVEDENGTVARWALEEMPDGVMATYALEGEFEPEQEKELRSELRAKVARLVLDMERSSAGR